MSDSRVSDDAFEARLRDIGRQRYHHRHPFNLRMHAGELGRDELWCRTTTCH